MAVTIFKLITLSVWAWVGVELSWGGLGRSHMVSGPSLEPLGVARFQTILLLESLRINWVHIVLLLEYLGILLSVLLLSP